MMDSRIYRGAGLALCTAALVLTGCGGGDGGAGNGGSEEDAARQAVAELFTNEPAACDNLTDRYLKEIYDTEEKCRESSDGTAADPKPEIDKVSVEGDTAEAIVLDEDRSTVSLVKQDGDWLIDDFDVEEGAGNASGGSEGSGTAGESGGGDEAETEAQGTADAFLQAIRDEDKDVFCGILSERYAMELLNVQETGVGECVTNSEIDWGRLQGLLASKSVEGVEIDGAGGASVSLSGDTMLRLTKDGERFVIDQVR